MTAVTSSVLGEFCEAGLWPGVGPSLAQMLADAGITTPAAVTEQALAALPAVTDKKAKTLFSAWVGAQPRYALVELLLPHGLPIGWARRLIDRLGDRAASAVAADPWQVLVLPSASIAEADRLARAREPQVQPDDPRRLSALVARALAAEARSGHTCSPAVAVAAELSRAGLGSQHVSTAIIAAETAGVVRRVPGPDGTDADWVCPVDLARAEERIAGELERLRGAARPLASSDKALAAAASLDEHQRQAVAHAAQQGVSLLTGGPGTGKSRTVTAIVRLCRDVGATVALAAPTGRAAKRLTELLREAGMPVSHTATADDDAAGDGAVTIHRLLGARVLTDEEDGVTRSLFEHDADNPVDVDMVVIDEASMVDAELAAALLVAIPSGAHVLFVGDPAQLPSIGPGQVLADLLASGRFPATELTTLYRQSEGGAIARLATEVRQGSLPPPSGSGHEVVIVPASDSDQAAHRVVQLVTDSIPRVFGTAPEQIQVITPVHRGPAGTAALNEALKAVLNPTPGGRRPRHGYDVGDRVVATANHFDAEPNGYANGEIGTVTRADGKSIVVDFPGGAAEISGKALGDLLHGWAITVHRAQGSEWDAVVAVFPREAGRMLSRPLVYTALTRARTHLSVVHAAGPSLAHAVRRIGATPRRTRLASLVGAVSEEPSR